MDKPEKINDSLSLFSLDGSLDFGTDAYLLSAYVKKISRRNLRRAWRRKRRNFNALRRKRKSKTYHRF